MPKRFDCPLVIKGGGGSVKSFTIRGIEAETPEEAKEKAKLEIFKKEWHTRKYLEDGAQLEAHEVNGEA